MKLLGILMVTTIGFISSAALALPNSSEARAKFENVHAAMEKLNAFAESVHGTSFEEPTWAQADMLLSRMTTNFETAENRFDAYDDQLLWGDLQGATSTARAVCAGVTGLRAAARGLMTVNMFISPRFAKEDLDLAYAGADSLKFMFCSINP